MRALRKPNIGSRGSFRARPADESGFTLIELLVVMLILGLLASIAIPSFLNQKNKATDAQAKSMVRNMQTAIETCSTDNSLGGYGGCDRAKLHQIEPTIPDDTSVGVYPNFWGVLPYVLQAKSSSGTTYQLVRNQNGTISRSCSVPAGQDAGGCPGGTW